MTIKVPNLLIVGAPKCGTTSLYTYLKSHPDVFFPDRKEPHHFNTDLPGNQWHPEWNDYLELFSSDNAKSATYRGDASVNYLYSSQAATNIARRMPEARILICIRSPASFIKSYHNQKLINLDEDVRDLNVAWQMSESRNNERAREPKLLNYKAIGLFNKQIERYRKVFPDEQIRILTLEDLKRNPGMHQRAILDWLGLSEDNMSEINHVNPAVTHRSRTLARFLKYPPQSVREVSKVMKRLVGVQSLGLARILERANKSKGYSTDGLSPNLKDAIKSHYAADQALLRLHKDLRLISAKEEIE